MSNVKFRISNTQSGFSLIELIIVISIVATLLGLITINLVGSQQKASLNTVAQNLISDVRQQQIKAMIGDSQGTANADSYGIHTDSSKYVLFKGPSYLVSEPSNFEVSLPSNIQFVTPNLDIIFSRVSGEIPAVASLQLQDTTISNTKTIQFNRYGVITSVN